MFQRSKPAQVVQRAAASSSAAAAGGGGGGDHKEAPASKATLEANKGFYYRYVNTAAELQGAAPNKVTQEKFYKALQANQMTPEMGEIIATHMGGDKTGSPFISVTSDFNLAAQTTDNSPNGLATIVNSVNYIAILKFPPPSQGGPYTFTCTEGLPAKEGEVLVLLPPGKTLANYLVDLKANIYKGKQWMFQ
jgi:hypothetical protein